jgi:4,5:9,10-diseco-3-hydroxy-5,9,17-trioxoandrosta-1(10),2-diene-4-oate hydrolase
MVRFFSAGTKRARWFPAAFALYYRMVLPEAPAAEQRRRIVASAFEIAPVLAEAWRSFGAPDADIRPLAARVTCPVLLTWATRDRVVPLGRSLPAIHRFPNARVERYRAGHAPFLETPAEFARSLEAFLASC